MLPPSSSEPRRSPIHASLKVPPGRSTASSFHSSPKTLKTSNRLALAEPADEHLDDGVLGAGDVLVAVRQLTDHPAGQDLLQRAVQHERREPRVEISAELAPLLPVADDALDRL